jgi:glucosamine--fructose-6-phosphate aminotransferase (isomerizing)
VAVAGSLMAAEIAEQPARLGRLLAEGAGAARELGGVIAARAPRFVLLAARGTSDHAALYAKYLVEVELGVPAGLVSPSTYTAYHARPDLRDVLMVAVSQSGGSPDLVTTIRTARELGATTLAVTNAPASDLAAAAELHLDVMAGPERAVAATKSYAAELLALWMLVRGWQDREVAGAAVAVEAAAAHVARRPEVVDIAGRYRFSDRLIVTGRGFAYPTAREAALKLMETSYVAAHAFSGADLLHGPLAMIDNEHPVVAVVPDGVGATAMAPVLERLAERDADLLVLGGTQSAGLGNVAYRLEPVPEQLAPIADIVPLQWLALQMAVARGFDPDAPRGLAKVTRTT